MLVGACAHHGAVGEDDLRLDQVVDREPVSASEVADAAAEREPSDAGRRDDAARNGHADLVCGRVDLVPGGASADPYGVALRVDRDVVHPREIDDESVVHGAEPGAVVPAAADCDRDVVPASEGDGRGDVGVGGTAGDERRMAVDHRVVDGASVVVARISVPDQVTGEGRELGPGRSCKSRGGAHGSSPLVVWRGFEETVGARRRAVMTRSDPLCDGRARPCDDQI